MIDNIIKQRTGLFIFIVSFILLILCQYSEGIIGYTTRFPDFVTHMLHHGLTYFPIINGQPYPDYPIGNTFLIYLASLPFGKMSIFTIGVPYCMAAALTLVLIYKLGALHDKKWGLYGVLFALFTFEYIDAIHLLALDVYVTLSATFCFYLVYTAKLRASNSKLWLLPFAMLGSLLIRGPIGFIIPAAVVFSFYLLDRNWRSLIIFSMLSAVLFIIGLSVLFFAAYLQGGLKFLYNVVTAESIGKLYGGNGFRGFFYFTNGLINYAFAVLFALAVIVKKRHSIFKPSSKNNKFLLNLTIWFLMIIIALTMVHDKQSRYILSIVPAISLLAAYIFVDRSETFTSARKILLKFCSALPIIGLIGILLILIYNHFVRVPWQGYFLAGALSLLILLGCEIVINKYFKSYSWYPAAIFILGVLVLMTITFCLYWPIDFHLGLSKEPDPVFLSYWPW